MARMINTGAQGFDRLRENNYFYIDKTHFIKEWWENADDVTLITRPRRFGKTLTMDMVAKFFSVDYSGRSDLFEGLSIWDKEKYRELQGTYPVISLTFSDVKDNSYESMHKSLCRTIEALYTKYMNIMDSDIFNDYDRQQFDKIHQNVEAYDKTAVRELAGFLYKYYGKKVIILLDEYDTPMQESYVDGFWDDISDFMRGFFNSTFKANQYLERAILTGITRVSKESIFSDFNNPMIVTVTSELYADCIGFTEREVFDAMDEYGRSEQKQLVKTWYDGFRFGNVADIYNPWSIINYLKSGKLAPYWANTSSNALVSNLIKQGNVDVKTGFEELMRGGIVETEIDEQIVYNQLDANETAIWSLMLASGYLRLETVRVLRADDDGVERWTEAQEYNTSWADGMDYEEVKFGLKLTNKEVRLTFSRMVNDWFGSCSREYNEFIKSMFKGDLDAMNDYMNDIALKCFSVFDTGNRPSEKLEPERFYHGFVLGLLVELNGRYILRSNRESGYGRYDVIIEPRDISDGSAIIMEFKVFNKRKEKTLEDTAAAALAQIEEMKYDTDLLDRGIPQSRIRKYGFAFEGKEVLILEG